MRLPLLVTALVGTFACTALAADEDTLITPDETGSSRYVDDFSTPQVFRDAFLDNIPLDAWQEGSIVNAGPSSRTLTYRFYGSHMSKEVLR